MSKRETLEEFLKRGGTITKCDPVPSVEETDNKAVPTPTASSTIMTLSEGALYYSESKAKTKERKKKKVEPINLAALPTSLLKFVPGR